MTYFFEAYKPNLIYAAVVIATVLVLHFLTRVLYNWLLKKEEDRFPGEKPTSLKLLKTVLSSLWITLGVIALSFVFVAEESYVALKEDFNLVLYLGFLAVLTIVSAAATNMWFKKNTRERIEKNQDPTTYKFLRYVAVISICFIGVLFGLLVFPSLKGVAQTALSGAGVIALIAGVASQEALSNLIGGFFIIFLNIDTLKIISSE
jgi:small-conductance mechanosensitive channel